MNWVDLLLLILAIITVIDGIRRGFVIQTLELMAFVAAVWLALRCYPVVADYLVVRYATPALLAKPAAFLGLWLAAEVIGFTLLWLVGRLIPEELKESTSNHLAGIVPAALKMMVYAGVILTILVSLPLPAVLKMSIEESHTGPVLMRATSGVTGWLERALGRSFTETFNFLTTPPSGKGLKIPAVNDPTKLLTEPELEQQLLALVNVERLRADLPVLSRDEEAHVVARAHSQDMWLRGYFDHVNPDGKDVGDRFWDAGLEFTIAGENLALAPTILIAHEGLMRSPSHRENILHPDYRRLGIGVISAGANGLMVTQNFRD